MRKCAEIVLKYRRVVIVLALGLTVFFAYGITKVGLNTDMLRYWQHGSLVNLLKQIGDEYGGNSMALSTRASAGGSSLSSIMKSGVLTICGIGVTMLFAVTLFPALLSYLPGPVKTRTQSPRPENRDRVVFPDQFGRRSVQPKIADSPAALAEVSAIVRGCYHLTGVSALAGVEDYTEGIYHGDPQADYHEAQRRQHAYLLDEVGAGPGFRLLEIGCGLGTLMLAAKARGCEVTGVTISEDQYAVCQARGLRVVLSDYRALPKEWAGAFDGIVVNGALEHFCQPTDALAGQQDRIYENMFKILAGLLDPSSPVRCVVTTALHFRGDLVAPHKLLRSPWLQVFDPQGFHFAILHRGYGGYYPVAGQLEQCARGFFRLVHEVDGTQDYGFTAEDWLRMFLRALYRRFGAALLQHFMHQPAHTFWFTASFLGPASQLWQFRGEPTPVQHFRHTWQAVSERDSAWRC
jgi:cyclopropane fatty-acyl-phospholipid synthase-like methyltransferase